MLISTDQSAINITNCSFIDNDCTGSGNVGGVFRFEGATGTRSSSNTNRVYIDNCYFEGSSATNHGGVICSRDSYLTITNSKFINNEAPFSGAVHMHEPGLLIDNCTFINNRATGTGSDVTGFGAAVSCLNDVFNPTESYNYTIKNSYFEGNNAKMYGAAIEMKANYVTADNCTLVNNQAPRGAAISIDGNYAVDEFG